MKHFVYQEPQAWKQNPQHAPNDGPPPTAPKNHITKAPRMHKSILYLKRADVAVGADIPDERWCEIFGHKPKKYGDGWFCRQCDIPMEDPNAKG